MLMVAIIQLESTHWNPISETQMMILESNQPRWAGSQSRRSEKATGQDYNSHWGIFKQQQTRKKSSVE